MREEAEKSSAWPFVEARKLIKRVPKQTADKDVVLFETGYGPSGLPHIGTFGEVARTQMVRNAFSQLSDKRTKLIVFSDDMDGLRKIPDNIPNSNLMSEHLGKSLTNIPDPFGECNSFGEYNNKRLRKFLDDFGFDYEFKSSTTEYKSGKFDEILILVLENYEQILELIRPTLREERRKTYSPFLPICPKTGVVLQQPVTRVDKVAQTITYEDQYGGETEISVKGGSCKLQWKVDWAMRWRAMNVDYEMSGKDLIDSVKLSGAIVKVLGGTPPAGFTYELFLDENGEKISKTRGNGLTIEEWLKYAPPESLSQFMYQKPTQAKRLFFDVIPRNVDEYVSNVAKFGEQEVKLQLGNPVWHIHNGEPPNEQFHLSYNILLNLAAVCNTEDKEILWYFISRYRPGTSAESAPMLDRLVGYAIEYFRDFIKPNKKYRVPNNYEKTALTDLKESLQELPSSVSAEEIQVQVYEVGKKHYLDDLKTWFNTLYEILLGQSTGPRMGSFIALYCVQETIALINNSLSDKVLEK